jgi:adenylate kinase
MFHIRFNPSQVEGKCDKCGAETYQRDDDNEATIRNRLKTYHDQTSPLKGFYGRKGLVRDIAGVGDIKGITAAVIAALEK